MTMIDREAREQRRREQAGGARRLRDSGVLDDLFAKIDSGEVQLDGRDGLIQQLIKTGLERGLQAELTEHVGYERGDAEAPFRGCQMVCVRGVGFLRKDDTDDHDRQGSPRAAAA